jgi:hypothetical protein
MLRVRVFVGVLLPLAIASCNGLLGIEEATELGAADASTGGSAGTVSGGNGGSGGTGATPNGGTGSNGGSGGISGSAGVTFGGSGGQPSDGGDAMPDAPLDTNCAANLQIDKLNCGYCGHDCLGGDCVGGKCQPIALGTPIQYGANDLALGPDAVFVANGFQHAMHKVPKVGGSISTWGTGTALTQIREYQGTLYFNEYGAWTIWKVPATGALLPQLFHDASTVVDSLAVDASGVYFFMCPSIDDGMLYHVPLAGATTATTLTGLTNCGEQLVLDATTVYFSSLYDYVAPGLYKVAKSGGTPSPVTLTSDPTWALIQDGSDLYFTTADVSGYGELIKIKKDGTGKTTLTGGLNGGGWLVIDGGYLYVTTRGTIGSNYADGAIYRLQLGVASPPVDVVWENLQQPTAFAADATAFYWVERGLYPSGSGQIKKLAK